MTTDKQASIIAVLLLISGRSKKRQAKINNAAIEIAALVERYGEDGRTALALEALKRTELVIPD